MANEVTRASDADREAVQQLAWAGLRAILPDYIESLKVEDDLEKQGKGAERLLKMATPPARDNDKSGLPVFNLVIGVGGAVTMAPVVQEVEVVEDAVTEVLPAPETDVLSDFQTLLNSINNA